MQIVEFLQQFSNPVLDTIMRIITEAGDQYFFIIISAFIYWTIDKKFGFRFMVAYLGSAIVNGGIKSFTNRLRPYEAYPNEIKPIMGETAGSSMPSGHAQAAGAIGINLWNEYYYSKVIRTLMVLLIILVPLSRVYLGQHYLEDVLIGLALGLILGSTFMFLLGVGNPNKEHIRALYPIPILVILMFFIKNDQLFVASGAYIGLTVGYYLEKTYVKAKVNGSFLVQTLKFIVGIGVALVIKEGFKHLLPYGDNETLNHVLDFIRYAFIGLWATVGMMYFTKKVFKKYQ